MAYTGEYRPVPGDTEKGKTVPKPSMAEAALRAIELITLNVESMFVQAEMRPITQYTTIVRALRDLEAIAERRVDRTTYELHRAALRALNMEELVPNARNGS